jgi:hypothetical protein
MGEHGAIHATSIASTGGYWEHGRGAAPADHGAVSRGIYHQYVGHSDPAAGRYRGAPLYAHRPDDDYQFALFMSTLTPGADGTQGGLARGSDRDGLRRPSCITI